MVKKKKRKKRENDDPYDHLSIFFFFVKVMKRVNTYESGGDSDDEFIEYVFFVLSPLRKKRFHKRSFLTVKIMKNMLFQRKNRKEDSSVNKVEMKRKLNTLLTLKIAFCLV